MIGMVMQNSNSLGRKAASSLSRLISRTARWAIKLILIIAFLAVGLFVGGFFQFTNKVSNYSIPTIVAANEGIVALTGGSTRIADALKLMSAQKGKRVLISGVNKGTRKSDIIKINPEYHGVIDCCVDIERNALDTVGNAIETKKWIEQQGYSSIILVTSDYHMPRSLLEFRRIMPKLTILPYPVKLESIAQPGWWKNTETLRFMLSEYLKYVGAWSRDYISPKSLRALRGTLFGS